MIDLAQYRRFFAEEIEAVAKLQTPGVRHGDAAQPLDETFDAILVNAGVTHPLDGWLDALAPAAGWFSR